MTRDIEKRLQGLRGRRQGTDRFDRLSRDAMTEILAKSLTAETYTKRAVGQLHTQYVLGAMQAVGDDYTRIGIEEANRVGAQLESGLYKRNISVQFRLQGSVPCDIHIRGVSDVDLLALGQGFITYDRHGARAQRGEFRSPISYTPLSALITLRAQSEQILKDAFPAAKVDVSGAKAISLSGGSLRRPIDVVPSHWHDTADELSGSEVDRGVDILDKSVPQSIRNMPFRHIGPITKQDQLSLGGLKTAIRLAKNVKADALDEGTKIPLPSFDIAAVMWHADMTALAAGRLNELAILEETRRHLDYLSRNPSHAMSLMVPDQSRVALNTAQKFEGLVQLSLEFDDLALRVGREQDRQLSLTMPSVDRIGETLQKAMIPA